MPHPPKVSETATTKLVVALLEREVERVVVADAAEEPVVARPVRVVSPVHRAAVQKTTARSLNPSSSRFVCRRAEPTTARARVVSLPSPTPFTRERSTSPTARSSGRPRPPRRPARRRVAAVSVASSGRRPRSTTPRRRRRSASAPRRGSRRATLPVVVVGEPGPVDGRTATKTPTRPGSTGPLSSPTTSAGSIEIGDVDLGSITREDDPDPEPVVERELDRRPETRPVVQLPAGDAFEHRRVLNGVGIPDLVGPDEERLEVLVVADPPAQAVEPALRARRKARPRSRRQRARRRPGSRRPPAGCSRGLGAGWRPGPTPPMSRARRRTALLGAGRSTAATRPPRRVLTRTAVGLLVRPMSSAPQAGLHRGRRRR